MNLIENPCITNSTKSLICDCLKQTLSNYCESKTDKLPELINEFTLFSVSLNILHLFTLCLMMGLFSGYYRRKISHKLNIIENNKHSFILHCCPIIHLLALCQENRTINKIGISNDELIKPINVVDVNHVSETRFIV